MLRLCLLILMIGSTAAADGFRLCGKYHDAPPQMVLLRRNSVDFDGNMRPEQICSGAVIAPNWVLTARHCVDNARWAWFSVEGGSASLAQRGRGFRRFVEAAYCPEESIPFKLDRDIVLLRLNRPVPAEQPLLGIASLNDVMGLARPVRGVIAGISYGAAHSPQPDISVRQMYVTKQRYRSFLVVARERKGDMLPCSGESGSIFSVRTPTGPKAMGVLTALVNFKNPTVRADCGMPDAVAILTDISAEAAWISNTISACDADLEACLSLELVFPPRDP